MTRPDPATLRDLREKLRAATGPDRELDCEVFCGTAQSPFRSYYPDCVLASQGGFSARVEIDDVPRLTASIDAALALVERVLPGCQWSLEPDLCWIRWLTADDVAEAQGGFSGRDGKATPLAILDALLSALIAQAEAADAP